MAKRDDNKPDAEDKVGYGHPPKHSRFKKGTSGNPSGRPRADHTIPGIVAKTMNQKIRVTTGNRTRLVSVIEAIVLKLAAKALSGNAKEAGMLFDLCEKTDAFEKPLEIRVRYIDPKDPGSSSTSD